MNDKAGEHDFILERPITAHFKGEGDVEVLALTLKEPGREHIKKSSKLKQMITRAMMEAQDVAKEAAKEAAREVGIIESIGDIEEDKTPEELEKESENLNEAISMTIMISKSVDLGEFIETFISMAIKSNKKSIVLLDGRQPIRDVHFDLMSNEDIERLAFAYTSFFTTPSVLQEQ